MLRTLGQQQPVEMWRFLDQFPEACSRLVQVAPILEYIRHARAKDAQSLSGLFSFAIPQKRLSPMRVAEESTGRLRPPKVHSNTPRPCISVTVRASVRNLHATPPRIECVVCPFDLGILAHGGSIRQMGMHWNSGGGNRVLPPAA